MGAALPATAQIAANRPNPASRTIRLRSKLIDTRAIPNLVRQVPRAFEKKQAYVIQLDGPMSPRKRAALRRAGIRIGDYLPDNAYIVRLNQADPRALARIRSIKWAGKYSDTWKIDPQIGHRLVPFRTLERMALELTERVQLVVTLFEGEDLEAAKEALSTAGAEILGGAMVGNHGAIDVVMDANQVENLAAFDAVQFVEEAPEPVMRNSSTYWIIQSNVSAQAPVWDRGLHGEGQIGGIIDGPPKESHCSFDDAVAPGPSHRKFYYYDGSIGADPHGTHVCGTMAGDQSPYGQASYMDGMAFAARMTFIPVNPIYANPSTFINRLQDAYDPYGTGVGARVHSNSWGDDGTTSYTTWCRQIDQFSWDHEDSLVAFAITNTGTLKTPENAKNVLAVGASQDAPNQDNHSSGGIGPTSDGRRKPEIYAPGCSTQSASYSTTCGWRASTGTSMACPAISGKALLARQYYTDGFYPSGTAVPTDGFTPTGALLRATLINAAVDMTGISGYPSNLEGWGRLLLDNSLYFPGDARHLYVEDVWNANGLNTGEQAAYHVEVVDDSVPLRVTLVWTDWPATVGANNPVVNDLDLEVQAPDGTVFLGNVFNTSVGESIAGGSRDTKNNVEQVHRLVPALGGYDITVKGTAINQSTQGYALVVTGGIQLTPPDCNGNGIPDDQDIAGGTSQDCDGNGRPDECDPDCNGDNIPDVCSGVPDCNANGIPDDCDITQGTSQDCNGNGVPDECDLSSGTAQDCNGNGVPDDCDIAGGTAQDCNGNAVPDVCDISQGTSADCNGNTVPDECDIAAGSSEDCNGNGIPDECDLMPSYSASSPTLAPLYNVSPQSYTFVSLPESLGDVTLSFTAAGDLDGATETVDVEINGTYVGTAYDGTALQCSAVGDEDVIIVPGTTFNSALVAGTAQVDMIPSTNVNDICTTSYITVAIDYLSSTALDCNTNGVPDECETDCNANGVPDDCDIAGGTSDDLNANGIPDECETLHGNGDCNQNGTVDLNDFATFAVCFTGPGGFRPPQCLCVDLDGDGDVDLDDFAQFAVLFNSYSRVRNNLNVAKPARTRR
jgi:hypothetical protein